MKIAAHTEEAVPRSLKKVLNLEDFTLLARRRLPRPLFGYVQGAVEDNCSFVNNRQVFSMLQFVPRILVDISQRTTATRLFDVDYAAPFGIAPMGLAALMAYRGDTALAEAAAKSNIPMIMSGSSLTRLEDLAHFGSSVWFQAYLPKEMDAINDLVDRAASAGYQTLVVTVDTPTSANRENNVRAGFSTPLRMNPRLIWDVGTRPRWLAGTWLRTLAAHGMPHFENSYATRGEPILSRKVLRDFSGRGHLNWSHFSRIRDHWKGRLIVKGILHWKDAEIAVSRGADGLIVSNHGGRQLDTAVSPLCVLPDVVRAAHGVPVMMDGGIRRGGDVLKALALGASFVFVGRPFLFAAAVAGSPGVAHAIRLLQSEVHRNMGLLGINSVCEMNREFLRGDIGHLMDEVLHQATR